MMNSHTAKLLSQELISKYKNKVLIIKYGGSIMENPSAISSFVEDLAFLRLYGIKPVIVHGGGKEISKRLQRLNIDSQFLNGYRVTSEEAIEEIEMVLKGKVNNQLLTALSKQKIDAVGLSGKDMRLIEVTKKCSHDSKNDYGFVGDIKKINNNILTLLINNNTVPVIAPIGYCDQFSTYNINADDVASAISASLKAEALVLLTDVDGLFLNFNEPNSLINTCDLSYLETLIKKQILKGAILPKALSCINALKDGVKSCHVINGSTKHSILLKLFSKENFGTSITKEATNE
ncbi:MAG: acetylglutamate kinase [Clostridiales bacterium]|nr:acetylglutamate kinase [Clostridiales bacterium]